jgi:cysteine protease ATG4
VSNHFLLPIAPLLWRLLNYFYRTLVNAFPEAGIGVSVATDGTVFESEVFAASHSAASRGLTTAWGDRAVLVLVGIRLGLDGVNPVYYDSVKVRFRR